MPLSVTVPGSLLTKNVSLAVALILSGSAALVYQSTWGRMLQRIFGVSDLAVATVLATFFLGLGLGAALGGRWARRLRSPALAYAVLEAAIGAWALLSLLIIPRVHGIYAALGQDASFETLTAIRFAIGVLILLPPTLGMGATMPILIDAIARASREWSTPATWLYAANTLGAVVGAGLAGFWLLPSYGARTSIVVAAGGSFLAGGLVWSTWRRPASSGAGAAPSPAPAPADEGRPRLAMILGALAGFSALAGEVVWTRVLRIVVQGTTHAFGAMLVNFLLGIAIGSVLADRLARRSRSTLRVFAATQLGIGVLVAVAMWVTPHLPRLLGLLRGDPDLVPHETGVLLTLSALLLLPLAVGIGTSIPIAWRLAGGSGDEAARRAGRVLAANTLGGLAGSLAAGFSFVPMLGVDATLMVLVFLHALAAMIALGAGTTRAGVGRALAVVAPFAAAVLVLLAGPSVDLPFLLHARLDPARAVIGGPGPQWQEPIVFLREGRNTTVTIRRDPTGLRLFNDGRPESGFAPAEPGFGRELAALGGLPLLMARTPERAMVIGLGAGHTTSVLLRGSLRHVDVVELEDAVVEAARFLHRARNRPFPLDDRRARLIVDDARAQMVLSPPRRYDAIVSQPSHPWLAGSSALYTREFFAEARRVLRPGGVIALWLNLFRMDMAHLRSVVRTLLDVFPHAHAFVVDDSSMIFVGSEQEIAIDARFATRLGAGAGDGVRHYLDQVHLGSVVALAQTRELDTSGLRAFGRGAELIRDDRPSLEFDLGRTPNSAGVDMAEIDRATRSIAWISASSFRALPRSERMPVLLARIAKVHARPHALARVERSLAALEIDGAERSLLEGALAEVRGNVPLALRRYDDSPLPLAASRADILRRAQGEYEEALRVASTRRTLPTEAGPLLSSAAAVATPGAILPVLATAQRVRGDRLERPIERVLAAFASGGCTSLPAPDLARAAATDEHVAFLGERCAIERGDLASARELSELRMRARRVTAAAEAQLGIEDAAAGNVGGAGMHLRRALRANPAQAPAAAALVRILHRRGRRDEAAALLRRTLEAARGLPRSEAMLATVAAELGVRLDVAAPSGNASSTSTAPSTMVETGVAPE